MLTARLAWLQTTVALILLGARLRDLPSERTTKILFVARPGMMGLLAFRGFTRRAPILSIPGSGGRRGDQCRSRRRRGPPQLAPSARGGEMTLSASKLRGVINLLEDPLQCAAAARTRLFRSDLRKRGLYTAGSASVRRKLRTPSTGVQAADGNLAGVEVLIAQTLEEASIARSSMSRPQIRPCRRTTTAQMLSFTDFHE